MSNRLRRWVTRVQHAAEVVGEWQQRIASHRIPELVVYGLTVGSVALGVVLLFSPAPFLSSATFRVTFQLARPEVWGAAFVLTAVLLAVCFWRDRPTGSAPAYVLIVLYAVFGVTASIAPATGAGVPSAAVVYEVLAYFSLVAVFCCRTRPPSKGERS